MRWFVIGSVLVFLVLMSPSVRAQDDDDMGDGAFGADDGGDDGGYDSPADGDDDGGYDSPADGDDDLGGDESSPQPEYVSTIERDDGAFSNEQADSSRRVDMAFSPPSGSNHGEPSQAMFGGKSSFPPIDLHHRSRRSADPVLSRMKRSGHHGGGVVGPVHTYVRTDYDGNYRWGARHHVGSSYGRGK